MKQPPECEGGQIISEPESRGPHPLSEEGKLPFTHPKELQVQEEYESI